MSTKAAIVTGASQGIGRSTAMRLARDFDSIVLVARNCANLEETADAVQKAGAKTIAIDIVLARPEAAQHVVDEALAAFSRIDALLNIAGGAADRSVRHDRRTMGRGPRTEASRRAQADGRGMAVAQAVVRIGRADVGEFRAVSEGAVFDRRHDQRGNRRAGESVFFSAIVHSVSEQSQRVGQDLTPPLRGGGYLQRRGRCHRLRPTVHRKSRFAAAFQRRRSVGGR
ncbi:SDR family NAD(P)-dependent oxidoreductase [Caballeronia sp. GACF4]|uniref:SDR family NAD(P)-dependent oxidoreductase n=1 Tax=Caballeronia sp. GACF4 TaxID=2921763 RepID=UPI0032EB82E8